MKKTKQRKHQDELRAEYDPKLFGSGVRGKYATKYGRATPAKKSRQVRNK